jgi:site-specific DNA-methyltransferase (adenine-specific)
VNDATVKGSETGTSFKQALAFKNTGFNLHDTMIWKKTGTTFPSTVRYYPNFEYMFILTKGKPKTVNLIADRQNKHAGDIIKATERQRDGSLIESKARRVGRKIKPYGVRFNVWEVSQSGGNPTTHPAVFPVRLATDHIISWSDPGDVVLDPFMGSGTTAVAAIKTGRKYIGFECSAEYCNIAQKRIQEEK